MTNGTQNTRFNKRLYTEITPETFRLMAKYDVFNEDGVPHRLTAHENGTNVFLEARKCIRRLMAKTPVDEYDLRIKFPGKDF